MKSDNWYQASAQQVADRLHTDLKNGLRRRQVRQRLRQNGENTIYPVPRRWFYNCLRRVLLDFTTILLIVMAIIAVWLEQSTEAAILTGGAVLYVIVSIAVFTRAQHVLERMDRFTLPVVRVVRDGKIYMVEQNKLVVGDLVYLSRGDIVPADLRLSQTEEFSTQEDNLFAVQARSVKDALTIGRATLSPQVRNNMAYASTLVATGHAQGIVVATGDDTLVSRLKKNTPVIAHEKMSAMDTLQQYSRVWSVVMLGLLFFLTVLHLVIYGDGDLYASFLYALTFAVSSMSEMLVPFACVVVACGIYHGVRRYRDSNAGYVIKKPLAIDRLKDLTCLVLPKDGVFTSGQFDAELISTTKHTYHVADSRAYGKMERCATYALLSTGQYSTQVLSDRAQYGQRSAEDDALITLAKRLGIYHAQLDQSYPLLAHREVDRDCSFPTSLVRTNTGTIAVMRGTPTEILHACGSYRTGKEGRPMDENMRKKLLEQYRKLARENMHIIAVASKKSIYQHLRFPGALHQNMQFEGFVSFRAPFLRGVGQTVKKCRDAGIKVVMLCDDDNEEHFYFAKQLGIISNDGEVIGREDYAALPVDIKRKAVSYYKMYCGLDALQQSEVIHYLRLRGERVGYLGASLTDLPMMQQANVTFTRSVQISSASHGAFSSAQAALVTASKADTHAQYGCEALKFTADVIVSDADAKGNGGFNAIADAIAGAKLIDRNLSSMVRYLFTSQVARFCMVLLSVIFGAPFISALQVYLWGLVFDFLSVLIIAFERPVEEEVFYTKYSARQRLRHPIRMFRYATANALVWSLLSIGAYFLPALFGFSLTDTENTTAAFLMICVMQLMVLLSYKRERWIFRRGARFSGSLVLYVLFVIELFALFFLLPGFGAAFGVYPLRGIQWIFVAGLTLIGAICLEIIKYFYYQKDLIGIRTEERRKKQERKALHKASKQEQRAARLEKKDRRSAQKHAKNAARKDHPDIEAAIDGYHGRYIAGVEPDEGAAVSAVHQGSSSLGKTVRFDSTKKITENSKTDRITEQPTDDQTEALLRLFQTKTVEMPKEVSAQLGKESADAGDIADATSTKVEKDVAGDKSSLPASR